ncbi:MAG: hypothetical protein HYW50_05240 [Candidatus Diapherotrites archaeon]|nr:hypothetical protein [Candidatus Diapherotrites archaeon]
MVFGKDGKHIFAGTLAGTALLLFYFAILSIANSPAHAITQFFDLWFWVLALAAGFGTQVGLYSFIRTTMKERALKGATAQVVAAGGVSTGSMVACCAHHLTDLLPIIGLSGAAIFLTQYQLFFILTGIFSNTVGITMMLGIIQQHQLAENCTILKNFMQFDMKKTKNLAIALSVFVLGVVFWLTVNRIV